MPTTFWFICAGLIALLVLIYIWGLRTKIKSLQNTLDSVIAENLELKLHDDELRKKYPLIIGLELTENARANKKMEE